MSSQLPQEDYDAPSMESSNADMFWPAIHNEIARPGVTLKLLWLARG